MTLTFSFLFFLPFSSSPKNLGIMERLSVQDMTIDKGRLWLHLDYETSDL